MQTWTKRRSLALLMMGCWLAIAALLMPAAAAKDEDGADAPVKKEHAGGKQAAEKKDVPRDEALLDPAVVEAAQEICPDMLEARQKADELYVQYRQMALTRGLKKRKEADKDLPEVMDDLKDLDEDLADMYEDEMEPRKKLREKYIEEENKNLERLGRLEDRGRDTEKLDAKADEITAKLKQLEEVIEVLRAVGQTTYDIQDPRQVLIKAIVKPSLTQEAELKRLQTDYPDLFEGRLYIEHLGADLDEARLNNDEKKKLRKIERHMEQVQEKFADMAADVCEDFDEAREDLDEEKEKLMPKIERTMGKRSGRKYQEELSKLERKIETNRDCRRLLLMLCKGTDAEDVFKQDAKKDDEKTR
jgi:DNA repair exonuclease SbcCD ATPase subunit